jgi:hypothetical protein
MPGSLPVIYVFTARNGKDSDGGLQHDAFGYGLTGYGWFISEVRRRRDIARANLPPPLNSFVDDPGAEVVTAIPVMDRGNSVNQRNK